MVTLLTNFVFLYILIEILYIFDSYYKLYWFIFYLFIHMSNGYFDLELQKLAFNLDSFTLYFYIIIIK